MLKDKKIYVCIFFELCIAIVAYILICKWSFGEIKKNPIRFITGDYEQTREYDVYDLVSNEECINLSVENGYINTQDENNGVFIVSNFTIRSVEADITDYIIDNDEKLITTLLFYVDKNNNEKTQNELMKIGKIVYDLPDGMGNSSALRFSNYSGVAVKVSNVIVKNYKVGYKSLFISILILGIIILFVSQSHKFLKRENISLFAKVPSKVLFWSFVILAIVLVGVYVYLYIKLPHIIYSEFYGDSIRYVNDINESFWGNLIPKVFDCNMIESGKYRPRMFAFLWQYIDTNLLVWINSWSDFGIKMPLTLLLTILFPVTFFYVFKNRFPNVICSVGLFIGSTFLFLASVQSSTYLCLRSAKLVAPIIAVFLLAISIEKSNVNFSFEKEKIVLNILASFVTFIFCTFDEQILAVVALCGAIAILESIFDKRIKFILFNLILVGIFYITYYFVWGKMLFQHFTVGGLQEHSQKVSMIVTNFDLTYIKKALEICGHILKYTFANNYFFAAIVIAIYVGAILNIKSIKEKLISIGILMFVFCLSITIVIGLPVVYNFKDLQESIYFITPILIYIYGLIYAVSNMEICKKENGQKIVVGIFCALVILLTIINFNKIEVYHLKFFSINGGTVMFVENPRGIPQLEDKYDTAIITREQYEEYIEKLDEQKE